MRKDDIRSLGLLSYRSSLYQVAAQKACSMSVLTSDYGHGLGSAYSPSQNSVCEDTAASFRVHVVTAVYCVSAAKNCLGEVQEPFILERNCWELECERIAINYTLVTHFHTS